MEVNIASKSQKKFEELFPDKVKLRVRFSLDNLRLDDDMLNILLLCQIILALGNKECSC